MRTLRTTPPAPGSRPSCTSGKPTTPATAWVWTAGPGVGTAALRRCGRVDVVDVEIDVGLGIRGEVVVGQVGHPGGDEHVFAEERVAGPLAAVAGEDLVGGVGVD